MKRWKIAVPIVVVVVLAAAVFGWIKLQQNPTRAFWGMIDNNLATGSVTRELSQTGSGLSVQQYVQLQLTGQPLAHSLTVFQQGSGKIVTEEMSNQKEDLVRYRQITASKRTASGKPIDTSSVVGKWAKLDGSDTLSSFVSSGLFQQSLQDILPIGNLTPADRQQLIAYMHESGVFTFSPSKVKRTAVNGRAAFDYDVAVKPGAYISLMQRFGKLIGGTQYDGVDPNDYANRGNIQLTVSVDRLNHELLRINQASSGYNQTYSAFGLASATVMPKAVLTTSELEKRITALQ